MLNGEYIFYSQGVYLSGGSLLDPDYRPEVDVNTLFEGFLTVVNVPVYGDAWEQLRVEIVAAYSDPQFASLQSVTDPEDVTSFAGECTTIIRYCVTVQCSAVHALQGMQGYTMQ